MLMKTSSETHGSRDRCHGKSSRATFSNVAAGVPACRSQRVAGTPAATRWQDPCLVGLLRSELLHVANSNPISERGNFVPRRDELLPDKSGISDGEQCLHHRGI